MATEVLVYATNSRTMEGASPGSTYAGAHDIASAWGNDSSSIVVRQYYDGSAYRIGRSFLYFDLTEVIPSSAIILSAVLRLKVWYIDPDYYYPVRPPFDCVIQKSVTENRPSEPPELSDFNYLYYSGEYGRKNTVSMEEDVWTEIEITDLSLIIPAGMTKFAIRNDNEINNIPPFTGNPKEMESVLFYPYDADINNRPRLIINYMIPGVENIKAEPDSTQTAIKFYGEITAVQEGAHIAEKGFEYIVQDEEPGAEDTGIECIKTKPEYTEYWDIGEYDAYENEGNDVDFDDMLYRLSREEEYEHDTIWWFRAYYKDSEDNKYTAATWMKNVPSVLTFACTEAGAQQATGNGELTDKGANTVERLGFRIIKEYSGDLMGAKEYCNVLSGFKVAEALEEITLYDEDGIFIIGFIWTGIFYRDAFFPKSETPGDFELGIYSYVLGGGFLGEEMGVYLKPNDTYKIQAISKNDLGIGYGADDDVVTVTTSQNFLYEEDEPIVSPTSVEKTVTIGDIPEGSVATRVGIRLGRTRGCNEIDVFMDGEWGDGEKVTFFITDLVPGKKYYEEPYMVLKHTDIDPETEEEVEWEEEIIDDEEEEFYIEELEDEELDDIISTYEEINYKTIIREIGCEKISDQSFIDKAGRRRSETITNHLIQDRATCQTVIVDYLNKFQTIKLKVEIEYDIPLPFERQDNILIDDGVTSFKANGEGEILFKEDGEGENIMATSILAKIRKMDGSFISGTETILTLELEV